MTGPEFDELLSAYLDGEVTPEERATVEQKLERSPALRDVLDDFSDVSEAVRNLPRQAAPQEFPARVVQALRKSAAPRVLQAPAAAAPRVPQAAAAAAPPSVQPASRRWTWRHWTAGGLIAACGLAAVLLQTQKAGNEADALIARSDVREAPVAESAAPSLRSAAPMRLETSPESAPALATAGIDAARETQLLRDTIVSLGRSPEPGEILRTLDENASEVRVLEYVVTNVDDSAGQLRTLLARNGIQTLDLDPVVVESPATDGRTPSSSGTRLVYFEGSETEFEEAMNGFENSTAVLSVRDYGALADSSRAGQAAETRSERPVDPAETSLGDEASRSRDDKSIEAAQEAPAAPEAAALAHQIQPDEARDAPVDPQDELSLALKAAELATEQNLARSASKKLDDSELKQLLEVSNGVAVPLPPEAATPMANYVQQNRAPVARDGAPSQARREQAAQRMTAQAAVSRSAGVSRVLVIIQLAPLPAAPAESLPQPAAARPN